MATRTHVKYSNREPANQLLSCLCELQADSWFCDLVLVVSGREFYVHRIVMAAASPYFRSLITYDTNTLERQHGSTEVKVELSLDCLTSAGFEAIVNFVYTGHVWLSEDNVEEVLKAANALMVIDLERFCWDFIGERLTLDNCISIMILADHLGCSSVMKVARETVKENFYKICRRQEFLLQPPDVIARILHLKGLKRGENTLEWCLHETKTTILQEILNWVFHDPKTRKQYLHELMKAVNWCHYSEERLQNFLDTNEHVKEDQSLRDTLQREYSMNCRRQNKDEEQFMDVIVCAGGEDKSSGRFCPDPKEEVVCIPLNSTSAFDFLHLPPLNTARSEHAMVAVGNYLYVTGGCDKELDSIDSVERYDPDINQWKTLAPMPSARSLHHMVAREGIIYVVGGQRSWWEDDDQFIKNEREIFAYDIQEDNWKVLTCKLSAPRSYFCCVMHKTYLYVIGGVKVPEDGTIWQDDVYLTSVEVIDTLTETVHSKACLLSPVKDVDGVPGIVMGDFIYVSAGISCFKPRTISPPQLYDTRSDKWIALPMPTYKEKQFYTPETAGFWHLSNKFYMAHLDLGILESDHLFRGQWDDLEAYSTLSQRADLWPFNSSSSFGYIFAHYRLKQKAVDACKTQKTFRFKVPKNKVIDDFFQQQH